MPRSRVRVPPSPPDRLPPASVDVQERRKNCKNSEKSAPTSAADLTQRARSRARRCQREYLQGHRDCLACQVQKQMEAAPCRSRFATTRRQHLPLMVESSRQRDAWLEFDLDSKEPTWRIP